MSDTLAVDQLLNLQVVHELCQRVMSNRITVYPYGTHDYIKDAVHQLLNLQEVHELCQRLVSNRIALYPYGTHFYIKDACLLGNQNEIRIL